MKLDSGQKHILRLVARDADAEGWCSVSNFLITAIRHNMPEKLVQFKSVDEKWFIRLTNDGEDVVRAMEWLG